MIIDPNDWQGMLRQVRNALDDVLRGWAWEITHIVRAEGTSVIVAGRLIDADGTSRSGAAGGDSAEEAGVRALAVAAGLHRATVRWHEPSTEEPAGAPPGQEVDERPPRPAAPPVRGGAGLTERQASAIFAISRSLGWERERLLVWLHDEYGADELEGLSKVQASDVIGALQQLAVKQS